MKQIPQIRPNQTNLFAEQRAGRNQPTFLSTDYFFQAPAEPANGSSAFPEKGIPKPPAAFRRLSSEFFGNENTRDYVAELIFFTLIVGISAWSITSMIVAIVRLTRGY